jgi:hypothetical protein
MGDMGFEYLGEGRKRGWRHAPFFALFFALSFLLLVSISLPRSAPHRIDSFSHSIIHTYTYTHTLSLSLYIYISIYLYTQ